MSTLDPLVDDYLSRLARAAAVLPPDRRDELLGEIGEHIAVARASGAADDEVAVRNLLERLGEPAEIVAAAQEDGPSAWPVAGGWGGPSAMVPRPLGTGPELAAVLLLTAGSFVPVVGWVVGVVLLWMSSLWRVREKLLGTLVVPLGPGAAIYALPFLLGQSETCTSTGTLDSGAGADASTGSFSTVCEVSGIPGAAELPLTLVVLVAPVVVAVLLFRAARRRAARAPRREIPGYGPAPSPWGALEVSAVLLLGLGGFVVPVVGALIGLVLACVSPRCTTRDKVVAGALALSPAVLVLLSFVLPGLMTAPGFGGLLAPFLLLMLACPLAAGYLAVVLHRRPTPAPAARW